VRLRAIHGSEHERWRRRGERIRLESFVSTGRLPPAERAEALVDVARRQTVTLERVVTADTCRHTLAVMTTAGL
jgi:hypothetical protein